MAKLGSETSFPGFYAEERERVLGASPVLDAAGRLVSESWFHRSAGGCVYPGSHPGSQKSLCLERKGGGYGWKERDGIK